MALKQVGPDRLEDPERQLRIDLADRNGNAGFLKGQSGPWQDFLDYAVDNLQAGNWYYRSGRPPPDRTGGAGDPGLTQQKIMLPRDAFTRGFRRAFIRKRGRPATRDEVARFLSDIVEALLLNHRSFHRNRPGVPDPEIILFTGKMSTDDLHRALLSKPAERPAGGPG